MAIFVETRGLEEHQHPFYIIRYVVKQDEKELFTSVARYVHTNEDEGKVQFLEPDLKKIQKLPNSIEQINEVERVVKEEGKRLVHELKK
ncbi:hypothetical protein ACFO25_03315 [Paenactinomyces guangxiensis]|uniref:Uncharacterized protein n=1 Tax=Paenactinomyces guangxiensis TaxID=1490290 RepID=A0A7W2A9D2_9BACL|nr:hypothetical protein [Paenactinomyces guangxiensis]MBA4494793.1 hypothetical protein [Paenactinomyces guangxiensis]MBH8591876.1 hypothetical protein [Paenactinomyces guangxiensis]